MNKHQRDLFATNGIVLPPTAVLARPEWAMDESRIEHDILQEWAMDAAIVQPSLITAQNVGIPAYMANLLDPKVIRVLVTPMRAAEIYGETKKGTWTTLTAQFPMVESTGMVSSYGDYSDSGSVGSNYNWVARESYHFQTITQYGDRETEMFGLAEVNYVTDLNFSSALILTKFLNKSYFFGIQGLKNYGALNDPQLNSPISPLTKAASGTSWSVATADEVYNDVLALYKQAQVQLQGLINRDSKMTLALSPISEPYMGKVTSYTLAPVRKAIQDEWKNMEIKTAPEFTTAAGELVQLIINDVDGDQTSYCAFTEKMRAGRVIPYLSHMAQKKVGGTWGCIIRRPIAVVQMLGI